MQLPYITPDLPGIGGSIKSEPSHFVVEELPLYLPEGSGEHIYLNITRKGMTTKETAAQMAKALGVEGQDISTAGLKDKHAQTTQTFSVHHLTMEPEEAARRITGAMDVQVNWAKRHLNKLKTGHLLGNRFRILVEGPGEDCLAAAGEIAEALRERGLPNFYGPQRFGRQGDNVERGRQIIQGARPPKQKWLRKLLISAYQSQLFNDWLTARIIDGLFDELISGDVAKKTDTGGLFTVEDLAVDQDRFKRGELTYTGPIYGSKMRWAEADALEREKAVVSAAGAAEGDFKRAGVKGSRRVARLVPEGLEITSGQGGLWFDFALPKGSYATVVLREFMKNDAEASLAE